MLLKCEKEIKYLKRFSAVLHIVVSASLPSSHSEDNRALKNHIALSVSVSQGAD